MIDVRHWWPDHIYNMKEFQQIRAAYNKELYLYWLELKKWLDDMHLDTMSEDECAYWEKLTGLRLVGSETLEDRRRAIKGRLTSSLPYDEQRFNEVLTVMCGEGLYTLNIDKENKQLSVGILLAAVADPGYISDLMRDMAPADMVVRVYMAYNRWSRFQTETWASAWDSGADSWQDVKSNRKWQED